MKDTFDKPPIHVSNEPSIGAPVIGLKQQPEHLMGARNDLPVWVLPLNRRLDTVIRQQDEILYHLQHPWLTRWRRFASWFRRLG